MTVLEGSDILAFILILPKVIEFIKSKYEMHPSLQAFVNALEVWPAITSFLAKVKISDPIAYETEMNEFDRNIEIFFKNGEKSFLSTETVGDEENFYSHALRCYIPKHMRSIWQDLKCGYGIFSKESKGAWRHTNNKGNLTIQLMKRLTTKFIYA